MTKEAIIEKTIRTLKILPADKAEEVADFADYIMKTFEDDSPSNLYPKDFGTE